MNNNNKWLKVSLLGALLIVLTAQVILLLETYATRTIEIYKTMGQTGSWRGANFAFSQEAANFFSFLNNKIPQTTVVLIPTEMDGPEAFTRNEYVEFYLWPRIVEYCEQNLENCITTIGNEDYAVLITDLNNLSNRDGFGIRLQAFNDSWGIFLPPTHNTGNSEESYQSVFEIIASSLPPLVLLAALTLPGLLLARRTVSNEHGLTHLALGIGTGLGWLSFSLFISLWLGTELTRFLILGLTGLYWGVIGMALKLFSTKGGLEKTSKRVTGQELMIVSLLLVPIAWAVVLAVGNAYSHTDEIVLWGAKGYGIPAVGLQQGATERGTLAGWYPFNIPLLISSFLTLFGERLPESKLVFPLYFLGLVGLVYDFLRRNTQSWISLLGSLLLATTPFVFFLATMAHGNLPFTFYLVGGTLLLYYAQLEHSSISIRYWLWGALFLILAAWTRPEGIYLAWAVATASILFYRKDLLKEKMKVFWLLGGLGLYSLFWFFASRYAYLKPGFTDGIFSIALGQILKGNLHFSDAAFILRFLMENFFLTTEWGAMGWLLVVLAILMAWRKMLTKNNLQLVGFGLVILIAIFGANVAYSYGSFPGLDIGRWVRTGFMRLAFPGLLLLWIHFLGETTRHIFPSPTKKTN